MTMSIDKKIFRLTIDWALNRGGQRSGRPKIATNGKSLTKEQFQNRDKIMEIFVNRAVEETNAINILIVFNLYRELENKSKAAVGLVNG